MSPPLNTPRAHTTDEDPVTLSGRLLAEARASPTPPTAALREAADALCRVDPRALPPGGGARTAFWINVYNALMRHAVAAYDLRAGRRVPLGVFGRASYLVGGERFSLHVIYDRDFGDAAAALRWLRPFLPDALLAWVDAHPRAALRFSP